MAHPTHVAAARIQLTPGAIVLGATWSRRVGGRWRSPALVLLALGVGAPILQQPAVAAQAPEFRGRVLAGIVTDTGRTPIPDVDVGLLVGREIGRTVRTDAGGRFELADVSGAKMSIVVRRLGYHPRVYTIKIREGAARAFLPIVLDPMPAELEKVIVLARIAESDGRLREFYQRKSRAGWGSFIEREEIERRNPTFMSDILRMMPGVRVISTRFGNGVRLRGCRPTVWLDGLPLPGTELDEVVYPNDVAGVEVYRSTAGMPVQFMSRSGCGAIVVWTRVR